MHPSFIAVLLSLPIWCNAQQNAVPDEKAVNFEKFWYNTFQLPAATPSVSCEINIAGFRVTDARFDTSTIGFMQKAFPDTRRKLRLKNGTTADLKTFLDSSIVKFSEPDSAPAYEILCVVKKLWLSDEIYDSDENLPVADKNTVHDEPKSGIMLRLEFFASGSTEHTPLYRYDTTICGAEPIFRSGSTYLATALEASLKKLSRFSASRINASNKKLKTEEIEAYNAERFALPILEQPPAKGIYMNFGEFKNNQPSIKEFRVEADKKTDDIYAKDDNGNEILLRNVYGFSDGVNIYIKGAGNFFRLHRANKTFNMYGAKSLQRTRQFFTPEKILTMGLNPETFSKNNTKINYKLKHHPYQLDMETGDLN
ncbi:MAG: hypothetical protein KF862_12940 [Chitinophagaceae bacterium]|nr:hypothetical protein [Chitinophagaceae bacterium]